VYDCTHSQTTCPAFEVLDWGTARGDLASRREVKFTLPGADLGKLRSLLGGNCRRLVHAGPVSTVRSIYFDDAMLSACRANLDGLGRRRKVRLRWYDSLQPERNVFFEVKWRDNRIGGKHRIQLRAARPVAEMAYRQIVDGLIDVLPAELAGHLLASSEPVAVIEYRREHFASADGALRMTLDYDLAFYGQAGGQYVSTSFPHRLHSLVVLEGKTPIGRESELRELVHPLALRAGRCSKYVHGCRMLGLIPAAAGRP